MTTPAEKVAKGVAYLDEHIPDWREHVDLDSDRFNIQRSDRCIVGQLARAGAIPGVGGAGANFWSGWNSDFFADLRQQDLNVMREYGFDAGTDRVEVEELWRQAAATDVKVVVREVTPAGAVVLNPTEKELLLELLGDRAAEIEEQLGALKPQYREFLKPQKMTVQALRVAIRDV